MPSGPTQTTSPSGSSSTRQAFDGSISTSSRCLTRVLTAGLSTSTPISVFRRRERGSRLALPTNRQQSSITMPLACSHEVR